MEENQLFKLTDEYLNARQYEDECKKALKDASATVEDLELKLIEAMTNEELTSFKRDGTQIVLYTKSSISAEPERKEELWAAMKSQGYERLFSINPQTLSGEVKQMMEDNNGEVPGWLEGLVKQFDKPGIRVKK